MSFKESKRVFRRFCARVGLHFVTWLFSRLPYGVVKKMSNGMMAIAKATTKRYQKVAKESCHIAFGKEKTPEELEEIINECFKSAGKGMIEMIYFAEHPKYIKERVKVTGLGHVDKALQKGNGVIAITAHFGNFPLMILRFAQGGYKTNAMMRPTRDEKIEEYFLKQRKKLGLTTVYTKPPRAAVEHSLKVLRNNEVLFMPIDQNFGGRGGIFVDFFGQKAATATGPIVLAMRTKAVLLPMFIIRQKDDTHQVIIEPEVELEYREDKEEMVFVNTQKITTIVENYIRRFPSEWGWMHKRWKTKPQESSLHESESLDD